MRTKSQLSLLLLLLALALATLLVSRSTPYSSIGIIIASWFVLIFLLYLFYTKKLPHYTANMALFAFLISIINASFLALRNYSTGAVILLCLSLAGLLVSYQEIRISVSKKNSNPVVLRKKILDKELPETKDPRVEVYHETKKKATSKKRVSKKKVVVKKKTQKKRSTKK